MRLITLMIASGLLFSSPAIPDPIAHWNFDNDFKDVIGEYDGAPVGDDLSLIHI